MGKIRKKLSGKFLVGQLQNLYCSCQSEFSAFLMFNYQSLVTKNKDIAQIFKTMSKKHLDNSRELAKVIISLKGLPFYINSQNSPLTAFWLNPTTNLKETIKQDKKFLERHINNYNTIINKCTNEKIISILLVFKSCALDELDFLNSL